jgi:EmrB/QacA subfamily drug resistance transporter
LDRSRLTALIVACALLMDSIDQTVIATSLPAIAADIHVNPLSLKLALTSYFLSLAIFVSASGWAADRFGSRTIFRLAILIFTSGSILCGFSDSLGWFVFARFLQGFGGAMMTPVGRLLVIRSVPRAEMVAAFAWLTVPAMIGPMLGPPLGGFITTYFHWRWIFWINVPIGVLGLVLVSLFIENIREEKTPPLDLLGLVLTGIGFSTLVFGFTVAGLGFLSVFNNVALILAGVVALGLYTLHARRTEFPLIELKLFRIPLFRAAILGGTMFRFGVGASPFLLPLMLQIVFGMSAFQSGSLTFVSAVGSMAMKASAPRILRRFGFRNTLLYNGIIASLFFFLCGFFRPGIPELLIALVLLLGGFFRSLQFTSLNAAAFAEVDNAQMSRATSLNAVAQQVATSAGVAIGAGTVEAVHSFHPAATLAAGDFAPAFFLVGVLSAMSFVFFLRVPHEAGSTATGKPERASGSPGVPAAPEERAAAE